MKIDIDRLTLHLGFDRYLHDRYAPDVVKIILMNDHAAVADVSRLPKSKLVLFTWEPGGARPAYCELFSRSRSRRDVSGRVGG